MTASHALATALPDYRLLHEVVAPAATVLEHHTEAHSTLRADCDAIPNLHTVHICFLAEGIIEERRGSGRQRREAPHIRVSPGGDDHDVHCGADHARCLYIKADAITAYQGARRRLIARTLFSSDPSAIALAQGIEWRMRRAAPNAKRTDVAERDYQFEIESLAVDLMIRMARQPIGRERTGPPPWLLRARDLLLASHGAPLSLAALAKEADVHRVHLTRAFRTHFGFAPGEFLRRTRLEQARLLLLRSSIPVSAVAAQCGFFDQSHLTRDFQRRYGMAPGRYRVRHMGASDLHARVAD